MLAHKTFFGILFELPLPTSVKEEEYYSHKGPTGFDSETNWDVSMPSAGLQLVNLIFHTFNWRK